MQTRKVYFLLRARNRMFCKHCLSTYHRITMPIYCVQTETWLHPTVHFHFLYLQLFTAACVCVSAALIGPLKRNSLKYSCTIGGNCWQQRHDAARGTVSSVKTTKCFFHVNIRDTVLRARTTTITIYGLCVNHNTMGELAVTKRNVSPASTTEFLSLFGSNISTATHAPCFIQKDKEGWG